MELSLAMTPPDVGRDISLLSVHVQVLGNMYVQQLHTLGNLRDEDNVI